MPPLELYVLPWGPYPHRILLYLSLRFASPPSAIKITPVTITAGISMTAPGKPPGSVPILRLPDGTFIKQSLAILEYFEDIISSPDPGQEWQVQLARNAKEGGMGDMRGATAEERARTRSIMALADEATTLFNHGAHKGSVLFVPLEETSAATGKLAIERCRKTLQVLEENYFAEGEGEAAGKEGQPRTISDCVLYSMLQFSRNCYGVDLLEGPELPGLKGFYGALRAWDLQRNGAVEYPEKIRELACQWLPVE